jgi:hypothetical protein
MNCRYCFIELNVVNQHTVKSNIRKRYKQSCQSCVNNIKLEIARARRNKWKINNLEKDKQSKKKYKINNKEKTRARERKRRNEDPQFRLRKNINRAVNYMIKGGGKTKSGSILKKLPYTMNQLKEHIESLFESWMNWNNQGLYNALTWNDNDQSTWTWQLDHIIPQSKLLYTSMEDENFKICWSLSNLRPLSAKENNLKSNKF